MIASRPLIEQAIARTRREAVSPDGIWGFHEWTNDSKNQCCLTRKDVKAQAQVRLETLLRLVK